MSKEISKAIPTCSPQLFGRLFPPLASFVAAGRGRYEWALMEYNPKFSPGRVFRISFHWLVAFAGRVETEVKALQRRCRR